MSATFKSQFKIAKSILRIPRNVNTPKAQVICDNKYEHRVVWEFNIEGKKRYIVLHPFDKFGRGLHLHTADTSVEGSPLKPEARYDQHPGHIPEDEKGFEPSSWKCSKEVSDRLKACKSKAK